MQTFYPLLSIKPAEFCKIFWQDIKENFYAMLIESSIEGELPSTTKSAILSILYKDGAQNMIKKYRPISLLNTDYKIIAFVLAHRMHRVLGKLISTDPTGYVKNRYIGCNIRNIMDIYEIAEEQQLQGALVSLDFQRPSIQWNATLRNFNFGNNFV